MGGIANVILTFIAAILLYESGHIHAGLLAFVLPIIAFWGWGLMLRYNPHLIRLRIKRLQSKIRAQGLSAVEQTQVEQYLQNCLKSGIPGTPLWVLVVNAVVFFSGLLLLAWGVFSILDRA
jgi:hypothetical protein